MRRESAVFRFPAAVLCCLGVVDLIRGFMHTFLLRWSAVHVAGFDPVTTPSDQFFLLGVFGVSNFLTGFIFLLISLRARELSPYVLMMIPASYLLGLAGIKIAGFHAEAAFAGKSFMIIYLAVCIITSCVFLANKCRAGRSSEC